MKTIFKRMISLILLLIFAYFSASIPGYSPMFNPMLNPMKDESYDDVHEPEPPLPVVSAEPEETAALPVFIPPTPAPKPEYSFPSDFTTKLLTDDWFQECPSPGIIDTVDYPATDYLTGTESQKPWTYIFLTVTHQRYNMMCLSLPTGPVMMSSTGFPKNMTTAENMLMLKIW